MVRTWSSNWGWLSAMVGIRERQENTWDSGYLMSSQITRKGLYCDQFSIHCTSARFVNVESCAGLGGRGMSSQISLISNKPRVGRVTALYWTWDNIALQVNRGHWPGLWERGDTERQRENQPATNNLPYHVVSDTRPITKHKINILSHFSR